MPIDFKQLQEFIEAIAKTEIGELTIKEGDFELTIHKRSLDTSAYSYSVPPVPTTTTEITPPSLVPLPPTTSPSEQPSVSAPPSQKENWQAITSPMVGTFYRAPAPGEPSFVSVGDTVNTGTVVCIIEAMKLMNEIESEITGQVMEIAVENGEPVEYGQTLLWVACN